MDVCLRELKESNKRSFDSYSVWNSVLIISHITFRDRRVHKFLPTTFLEIAVFTRELKKGGVHARLSEDGIAAFLTQNERKESKNTKNIVLDGYYLLSNILLDLLYSSHPTQLHSIIAKYVVIRPGWFKLRISLSNG